MLSKFVRFIVGISLAVSLPILSLQAEENHQANSDTDKRCIETIKECFALAASEKLTCYLNASKAPACEGTELGALAYKRWSLSPDQSQSETARGFLGPQLVDQECLGNFDNQWSGYIINGDSSKETIRTLDESLDKCSRQGSLEILRP